MEEYIYLDNAATTFPKPEAVYRALDRANRNAAVNAGRGSYASVADSIRKNIRLCGGGMSGLRPRSLIFTDAVWNPKAW